MMAVKMPFGLVLMHRLVRVNTSSLGCLRNRDILVHKYRRDIKTFSTASVNCNENEEDKSDSPSPHTTLTSRQALLLRRRRPLSPVERISSLLPEDAPSPEVMQLVDKDQQDPKEGTDIQVLDSHSTQEEHGHVAIPAEDATETHHALGAAVESAVSQTLSHGGFPEEDRVLSPRLSGESLLAFGELLIAEYHRKGHTELRRMFRLQTETSLQSSCGIIHHDHIAGQRAGCFLKTNLGVPVFIRRASLEDYTLFMKRGPAITYPKDAAYMSMMMDVTEGDCVLESGSGSGAMSLFLSRAVGSKGSVLSMEVRKDHHMRAVQNYSHWRNSWSLRRGEEWPDNVQFLNADLSTGSSLLAGRGFHAVALDMANPHLVFPVVIPHLHSGGVCAVYLSNVTQITDLLEGLRCLALPLKCERIIELPIREWLVAAALKKDGTYCVRKAPVLHGDQGEAEETGREEMTTKEEPAFGTVPYIARPHPEQISHTAFLVKLRKCVT